MLYLGGIMYEQNTIEVLLLVVLLLSLAEQPWANHSALGSSGSHP